MARRSPLINVIVSSVMRASKSLRRDFGEVENLQVSRKGPADFVSAADRRVEQGLYEELSHARPDFGFLMEEKGSIKGEREDIRFIIDPVDGTTNFLHGIPNFAISVAVEEKGEIVAGVTYSPLTEELFWAEKGQGAYLNDTRLRVSGRGKIEDCVFATGIPFKGKDGHEAFIADMTEIAPQVAGIRRFGAASLDLAYVAAGRFDGFWESGLNPWDIAAGLILVQEAGGYATPVKPGDNILKSGGVIAGNDRVHSQLERMVRRARRSIA